MPEEKKPLTIVLNFQVTPARYCSSGARRARYKNPGIQRLKKPYFHHTAMIYQGNKTIFTSVFSHRIDPQTNILWVGTFDGYILKVMSIFFFSSMS
jgi:hypothetical protein